MKAELKPILDEDVFRYDIDLKLEATDPKDTLLTFSLYLRRADGTALMFDSGERLPEITTDGEKETHSNPIELGFFNQLGKFGRGDEVSGELAVHSFVPEVLWLGKIGFGGEPDTFVVTGTDAKSATVKVISQHSKFTVESARSKKIEFLESGVAVQNTSQNPIYFTYYTAIKDGDFSGNLGRIGLELLLPGDTKTISNASHHDEICERLNIKSCKVGDLPKISFFPFIVVYSGMTSKTFKLSGP